VPSVTHPWQHRWRRLRFALIGIVAGVLILAAVTMALGQLLLPLAARYPARVASILSDRLHRDIRFASLEGHWQPSGPVLVAHDVTLQGADGAPPLTLPTAEFKLDFGALFMRSRNWLNLRLGGVRLQLRRDTAGVWHVDGFGTSGGRQASLGDLSADLWVSDFGVSLLDERTGHRFELRSPQAHLRKRGGSVRFAGDLMRVGSPSRLHAVGLFADDGSFGRVYARGDNVDLKAMAGDLDVDGYGVSAGTGSFQVWNDWRRGVVVRSVARLDLANLAMHGPTQAVATSGLHGLVDFQRRADGDHVLWAADDKGVLALAIGAQGTLDIAAREVDLAPLLPWAALLPSTPPGVAAWLATGRPRGKLTTATAHWGDDIDARSVAASFQGLGIDAVGSLPGIDHVQGDVRGDGSAMALQLPRQATTVSFPNVFRKPFVMSAIDGDIAAWHEDDNWHLGVDTLDFTGEQFAGQARGEILFPDAGGRPFLDLYASITGGQVPAAKLFWPYRSMPEGTIRWLDRALVSGTIESAAALVRGSLADWPFKGHEGRFEGRAVIRDLNLNYSDSWPAAEHVNAVASFVDNGMQVDVTSGQGRQVRAEKGQAIIADFGDSVLDLSVSGGGTAASLLDFVRNSPVARNSADTLDKLKLGGDASFGFRLLMPLKKAEDFNLQGTAQLKDADLTADAWGLKLGKLTGPLIFDGKGMKAGPLQTTYRDRPATLSLGVAEGTDDPDKIFNARLHGDFSVAELVAGYDNIKWLGDLANGRASFDVGFDVSHAGNDKTTQALHVSSDLRGIELKLPAPAKKKADSALPISVDLGLPTDGAELRLALGDAVRARMRLGADKGPPFAATFNLGTTMPTTLPDKGMRFAGHGDVVDVSGWVQYATSVGDGGQGPGLDGIDINADHALVFGQDFGQMHLVATPGAEALKITVDSPNLAGSFDVPSTDLTRRGVTARLPRVYWPRDDATTAKGKAGSKAAAPVAAPSDATGATAAAPPVPKPAEPGIAPASVPPLHLFIGDLRLGDAKLGEARLETWPTDKGMHIDQLRSQSSSIQVTASGDWNGNATTSRTHLAMDFAAENLGGMLDALGFGGLFEGGRTQARLDASWPGGPSALTLANMNGQLRVDVAKGRIPEVQPGVGRLFGLVSLSELPRRLSLDFGDVLGKGLSFDSIKGDFQLADGNASTNNLQILGPAADITITGRTGLRARDYDQQVLVVPHLGNSLPVVGALAGGPVGAAAGFAVQGLLGRGLNKASGKRYTVKGGWDKPVFTPVDKKEGAASKTYE
jgi:uncharacterized protein (TIGR02099 family)